MTPEFVVEFAKQAITLTILLSLPMLGLGLAVGLLVSVFQAVTQIQEMTLTFVPKIVAVMLALLFFSSWMLIKISDYTNDLFLSIPDLIR